MIFPFHYFVPALRLTQSTSPHAPIFVWQAKDLNKRNENGKSVRSLPIQIVWFLLYQCLFALLYESLILCILHFYRHLRYIIRIVIREEH